MLEKKEARSLDLRKSVVNRKLIVWVFGIVAVVSLVMWKIGNSGRGGKVAGWGSVRVRYELQGTPSITLRASAGQEDKEIADKLRKRVEGLSGEYAVGVYRLKTGENYGFNQRVEMPAASIMKVPIMTAVLREAEAGSLKLEDTYILKETDKRYGSGPLELLKAGTEVTVERMLSVMGKNSDNTAPVVLARMIGWDKVTETLEKLGMTNSDFEMNTTTAEDVVEMWAKLYEGGIVAQDHREMMWEWLTESIYEERIPAGVPEWVHVVHKVGTDAGVGADAGIVECKVQSTGEASASRVKCKVEPMVVVILNQGVKREEAMKAVPEIVRMIWDYEISE